LILLFSNRSCECISNQRFFAESCLALHSPRRNDAARLAYDVTTTFRTLSIVDLTACLTTLFERLFYKKLTIRCSH